VRACAVKLAVTPKGKLNAAVPYVGGALEGLIVELLRTGTCVQLEQFRCACVGSLCLSQCSALHHEQQVCLKPPPVHHVNGTFH